MAETESANENITSDHHMNRNILLYPLFREGGGTGHLKRCLRLANRNDCFHLYLPGVKPSWIDGGVETRVITEIDGAAKWDWIVFDRKETTREELRPFRGLGPLLGLDEGGSGRDFFDYCIDTLPNLFPPHTANKVSLGFLDLPDRTGTEERSADTKPEKILITFGGEDAAGLTEKTIDCFRELGLTRSSHVTVVKGPLFHDADYGDDVSVLTGIDELQDILPEYDLVFTLFGNTCFEAVAAGVPVILFNPSEYHRKLSVQANLPEIGVLRPDRRKLKSLISTISRWWPDEENLLPEKCSSLAEYLLALSLYQENKCPGCHAEEGRSVARFQDAGYFRCSECGLIYQVRVAPTGITYSKDYFFSFYRKQYGKTYLEDFSHIKELSLPRLDTIIALLSKSGNRSGHCGRRLPTAERKTVLDVGCAYGPFLLAAVEAGFSAYGIDAADEPVQYVNEELDIPACRSDIESFDPRFAFKDRARFDIITMWYVIEHIEDLSAVLTKIGELLSPGGLFCFATPNGAGVSGTTAPVRFLQESPDDHKTIWDPKSARRLLSIHGFRVKKVKVTGYHPERFPIVRRLSSSTELSPTRGGGKRLLLLFAAVIGKILKWGDTFEVYAEKIGE